MATRNTFLSLTMACLVPCAVGACTSVPDNLFDSQTPDPSENGGDTGSSDTGSTGGGEGANDGTGNQEGSGGSGSGDGSGSGEGSGGSETTDPGCEETDHELVLRDTFVEIALDTSGSMAKKMGDWWRDVPTRFQATLSALYNSLETFPPAVQLGVTQFPGLAEGTTEDLCYAGKQDVGFIEGRSAADAVAGLAKTQPAGGTPTQNAVHFGLRQLRAQPADSTRFLVVVTDGAGNFGIGKEGSVSHQCSGDGKHMLDATPIVEDVNSAYEQAGIRTISIGLPGVQGDSDPDPPIPDYRAVLQELAYRGGSGQLIDLHEEVEPEQLHEKLKGTFEIIALAAGCTYSLPDGAQPDLLQISGQAAGAAAYALEPSTCEDMAKGYQYDAKNNVLFLCWASCVDVLKSDAALTATVLCPDSDTDSTDGG